MKSFSSSPSEVEVSTVLKETLSEEDVVSLSGSAVAWRFPWGSSLRDKKQSEYLAKFQRGNFCGAGWWL